MSHMSVSERGVYARDKCTCRYCGLCGFDDFNIWMNLTVDHIVPGAGESAENKALSCTHCNRIKNDYVPKGSNREEKIADARGYVERQRDSWRERFGQMIEQIKIQTETLPRSK
ncbi:MAG: HNH endonuclease [Candidatus Korobacteraceae bacterium]